MKKLSCDIVLDDKNKELNAKGTPEFPVAIYNDDLTAQSVPYHWHDELEIIVVTEGEMELVVELKKFVLKAGEGIFINSGRLHSCTNFDETDCKIKSFVFHSRFIYGDLGSVLYEKYFHLLLEENSPSTCMLDLKECELLINGYEIFSKEEFAYEFLVREKLTQILLHVIKHTKDNQAPTDKNKIKQLSRCKKMLYYIHQNFSQEISLTQIAKSAGVKESEALRCFKTILKTSTIKYLKEYRLGCSAVLLKVTGEPVINIGISCGFSEMSYYAKSFKEIYKLTPTQYRDKYKDCV